MRMVGSGGDGSGDGSSGGNVMRQGASYLAFLGFGQDGTHVCCLLVLHALWWRRRPDIRILLRVRHPNVSAIRL